MEDKDLIGELVKKKFLSEAAANKVLKEAVLLEKPAEDLIYDRRLVDEIEVAKIKSQLLKIPYKPVKTDEIGEEAMGLIKEEISRSYRLIPLEKTKDMLVVGMVRPDDRKAQEALRFIAKQQRVNLGVYLITPSDLEKVWLRYSPYKSEIQAAVHSISSKIREAETQKITNIEEGVSAAEEAPVIKIVASSLKAAVDMGASDIHIEPQRHRLRVRFRIDGDLKEQASLPLALHQPVISRVKVLSDLKLDENRIPQDGRFRTVLFGKDIDYRVSTFPTPTGEKVAIRILDPSIGLKSFEELGLTGYNLDKVQEGIKKPYGMIIITGPTGSGKTTTLYSLMQELNTEDVNVVSLEDPVEYFIDGLNQSQVRPEIGYDFASGLRQILRQDPDIIMVGEIRDGETAELAVHAALTGHIVLTTLHTNNSLGVIPRLTDLKVQPFLLPTSLNLMAAQRLVSKICQDCKKSEPAPEKIQTIIKQEIEKMPAELSAAKKFKAPFNVYRGQGCKSCKDKGTAGRIAIFEVFQMTSELSQVISGGFTERSLLEESRRQGMITLRQDGIIKALEGLIPIEEVLRETSQEL